MTIANRKGIAVAEQLPTLVDIGVQGAALEMHRMLAANRPLREQVDRALKRAGTQDGELTRDQALQVLAQIGLAYSESVHEAVLARRRQEGRDGNAA